LVDGEDNMAIVKLGTRVAEQIVGAVCERLESATVVALDSIVFFPAPI
jgi:hypothetical protein